MLRWTRRAAFNLLNYRFTLFNPDSLYDIFVQIQQNTLKLTGTRVKTIKRY